MEKLSESFKRKLGFPDLQLHIAYPSILGFMKFYFSLKIAKFFNLCGKSWRKKL